MTAHHLILALIALAFIALVVEHVTFSVRTERAPRQENNHS